MTGSSKSAGADEMATESSHAKSRRVAAGSPAAPLAPIPAFKYKLADGRQSHYGCILLEDQVFHCISDGDAFFAALGYTGEFRKSGLLLDEFLWERYQRQGAPKSAQCLQAQIAAYLHRHSAKFQKTFGRAYDETIGKCLSDRIDNGDDHCLQCPRHPQFAY